MLHIVVFLTLAMLPAVGAEPAAITETSPSTGQKPENTYST